MAKWADYLISAVKYDSDHEKIISVKTHEDKGDTVGDSYIEIRSKVVSNIENGYSYCTILKTNDKKWKKGEDIHIVKIDDEKFIRTDRNETKKDNLGNLPEF